MAMAQGHTSFRTALQDVGWVIVSDTTNGTSHPYELIIRRGRVSRRLLVYAWNISGEGAGRVGTNFRIQTTRPDEDDMLSPPGFLAVGLGWKADQGVFAAFDVWIKRTTGKSSSVHITHALLTEAELNGWATEVRADGPECAFQPKHVDRYLDWLIDRHQVFDGSAYPRGAPTIDGDIAVFVVDRGDWNVMSLRVGSRLALRGDHGQLLNQSLWKVTGIETRRGITEGGGNTADVRMMAERYGTIHNDRHLLEENT